MHHSFTILDGGVTTPKGYTASTLRVGIKESRKRDDLALLVSATPAAIAATFTTNRIQAAPVKLCRKHLEGRTARALIVNAGNANACTGTAGMQAAERMVSATAHTLGIPVGQVFVCSTGTIGIPLPVEKIEAALDRQRAREGGEGGRKAAEAIMTTDTVRKEAALRLTVGGHAVTLGGMAKGAGMIEPNMATMLAFLTTDAAIAPEALQRCLSMAVEQSFNRISVDGDESTNDTVLFMANGTAQNERLDEHHPDWDRFCTAVRYLTLTLAKAIVADGEGATKFVTVTVEGAASAADARKAARAISNSLLVKTSWFGGDPNWGRVIDAVGYSGAEVVEDKVDIRYDNLAAVSGGQVASGTALKDLERILAGKTFSLTVNLNLGSDTHTVYTCDCSPEYVRINSEYMT